MTSSKKAPNAQKDKAVIPVLEPEAFSELGF
jgi:hypothetical protein